MAKASKSSRNNALIISIAMGTIFTALILSSMTIPIQPANAASSTSYGQGYNAGRNDALDGKEFNDYCHPDNPDLRCAIYKSAYAIDYAAAELLHGNEVPRGDQDFSDRTDNNNNNDNDNI